MSNISRRKFVKAGLATTAGVSGLAVAAKLAHRYGLVPPDSGGIFGPGETLTYAAHRIFSRHSLAREFPRNMVRVGQVAVGGNGTRTADTILAKQPKEVALNVCKEILQR